MSTWRGASNGAARGASSAPALPAGLAGRPRGRGRGASRGASRGAAGAGGFPRSSNLSWRAPAVQQAEEGAMDDGQDEGDEQEQDEEDGSSAEPTPSAFPAFGSAPSAFGTPAFTGGASSSAFGGGGSVFGGGAASTSAFGGSAFGAGASAFGGSAFGTLATPSAFASAPPPPPATVAEAPAPSFVPSRPPSTNQISTLEVLGEDSESRKKRFESSLPNNRFMELKPLREAQRARDIKAGLIPDPLKPMRLDQATDFLGTCIEMCPEFEREEREYQNNVDVLERYPGTSRIDPSRAVKAFHRPAAGNDQPLPSDVRPPHILKSTLDYLFHDLLPTQPLHLTHPFLRDRTRAIRQDFTMQNERGVVAIECNERIARYHVLALGALREQTGFSESQELEQLRKVLKSLNEFYDDARISDPPIPTPTRPSFAATTSSPISATPTSFGRASSFPSRLRRPTLPTRPLPPLPRTTLQRRSRRTSKPQRRLSLLQARLPPEVPYLFGCILSTHFPDIRKNALEAMKNSYLHQHSLYPARTLAKVLGCDDEEEVVAVCSKLGIKSKQAENGRLVIELHKATVMKNGVITPHVSQRLVEAKRGSTFYQHVIDGASYSSGDVTVIPSTPSVASAPSFLSAPAARTTPPVVAAATTFAPPAKAQAARPSAQGFPGFGVPPATTAAPPSAFSAPLQPSASPFTPAFAAPASNPFAAPPPSTSTAPPPTLNPVAPSFVPSRPTPPPAQPPAPQPPGFSFTNTAPPLPPPVSAEPPAPRPVKKLPTPSFPTPAPSAPLPAPRKPSLQVVPPPPPPAPKIDRTPLIKSLAASLTDELLRYVVQFPVRRAVELALKERWERVRQHQQEGRRILTQRLTSELVGEAVRREVRRLAIEAARERTLLKELLAEWRVRTVQSQERRAAEEERRKRFGEVAGEIGVGPSWEEGEEEMDDEDVGGLDMSSLSIERGGSLAHGEGAAKADRSMAARLKQAESDRHRIWSPATFLDIISERIDTAFSYQHLSQRPSWSAIVSTADVSSPFASWLACKFDLSGPELVASMDTAHVDVDVQMVGDGDTPSDEAMADTGLIIFDCTAYGTSLDSPWTLARQRLAALVQKADRQSLYKCDLLIIHCPDRSLLPDAEAAFKTKLLSDLAVSSLSSLKSTSVLLARLQDAESQLVGALDGPLSAVEVRRERVLKPLAFFVEPLLEIWRARLQQAAALPISPDPLRLLTIFIEALNTVLGEARTASTPAAALAALPGFGANGSPLRSKLRPYIQRPAFASAGHFPFVDAELSRRPPIPDFILAKLLLEHLANFALTSTAKATTRQQTLAETLPTSLKRFESSLQASVASLTPVENGFGSLLKSEKKRKASLGPALETSSHKKQLFDDSADEQLGASDRLSALDAIMRDARGLLAR
ncbi:hypothetical protein BCR35DRAFT_353301 [Leucosporidium creatinivorum]|uniref:SAC3/GANP/THP3 conserved domain-containing protein n=1 Tax=Leucosporidium creatinivorum TaxID=106004 RepID=A0A1Y2F1V0_9BASI|nr:hypothetical protein BCR35DRAFT_353301 [Leucosporidium creatinivorum]